MKKIIIAICLLSLIVFINSSFSKKTYNVVIMTHQSYLQFDEVKRSYIFHMSKYFDKDVDIVENFNAKSNIPLLEEKIESISKRKNIDLILSVGTHTTKRLIKKIKNIPIIFTQVGDPVNSGIVKDWKSSHANYTGVGSPMYYERIVCLMYQFIPFKKLGIVYLKGSPNHEACVKQIKKLSKKLKFEFVYSGFPLRNGNGKPFPKDVIRSNIRDSLNEIGPKVDAIFVQSSNTFTKNFDLFRETFVKYMLISCGDTVNIKKGLMLGISKDAHDSGKKCAFYSFKILKKGVKPKNLPMDIGTKLNVDINLTAFELSGCPVPFNLISGADCVYE